MTTFFVTIKPVDNVRATTGEVALISISMLRSCEYEEVTEEVDGVSSNQVPKGICKTEPMKCDV